MKYKNQSITADLNTVRRSKYASDLAGAGRVRDGSRERYQEGKVNPRKLANGLLAAGESREVICGEMDAPITVETFTIPQAAEALGRSLSTIRRWLDADKMPAPHLQDINRKVMVYSVGELEVMARIISQLEESHIYLATEQTHVVETLHQATHAYRAQFI